MQDSFGRDIKYLRLSLTERCNLRCTYCRAEEGFCPKAEELSAEELILIVKACASLGINRVRLTGGEPLLRKDIYQIIRGVAGIDGIEDLSMTTNGQFLPGMAKSLKQAGLMRLNVSLDSLHPEIFRQLTGGEVSKVLAGIDEAITEDLLPIKINIVLMRGINDSEVDDFIHLTKDKPIEVRFIEYMPIGEGNHSIEKRINNHELIVKRPYLHKINPRYQGQPSEDYQIDGYQGRVGFISPISHRFCHLCNRIRVMSDGNLRLCLGQEIEIPLKEKIQKGEAALVSMIRESILSKPLGHNFDSELLKNRNMSRIGG